MSPKPNAVTHWPPGIATAADAARCEASLQHAIDVGYQAGLDAASIPDLALVVGNIDAALVPRLSAEIQLAAMQAWEAGHRDRGCCRDA